ncbi:MAG: fumarate hydratase [Candidatus Thorarchaeota archaeon]|nr:MAG: fumarate hydratase [Candidatus Thorarchaeota archaeon]
MKDPAQVIHDTTVRLLRMAATVLPNDVEKALRDAYERETNPTARTQLEAILKNIDIARTGIPMCQDTGIMIFYVKVGDKFPYVGEIRDALTKATIKATAEIPLRPNAVNPIVGGNSGNNVGEKIPWINWEIVSGDSVEITAFPKGGGSENVCILGMLKPGVGLKGVKKLVVDNAMSYMGKACAPNIIGIGIGGGSDIALKIAKQQLLRPLDDHHPDPEVAKIEEELKEAINATGIGPMGLGGDTTVLAVKVDYAMRHPASLPVGVAVQCWAARRSTAVITRDLEVKYLTHPLEGE